LPHRLQLLRGEHRSPQRRIDQPCASVGHTPPQDDQHPQVVGKYAFSFKTCFKMHIKTSRNEPLDFSSTNIMSTTNQLDQSDAVTFYGFTPVPRDPEVLFKDHPTASGPNPKQDLLEAKDLAFPDSELVRKVKEFVKKELDEQTYNHSHRVFIFGQALIQTHFPTWRYSPQTYYLSCLLHDIGTAQTYLSTTKMSFEFKGAIVSRDLLLEWGAEEDEADAVCEAIIRHQDVFVTGGNITMIGQVLQLATILDNIGIRANLLHPTLIKTTNALFPRKSWSNHFGQVIEKELTLKPWCHTSTFERPGWNHQEDLQGKEGKGSNFATDVRGNEVMREYD